ncbi:MAG: hypothetical protein AB7I27_03945 [Bacteriovoracaceae bacterium]
MVAYNLNSIELIDKELFTKIQLEIVSRYSIDENLASEMAWDLIEVLSAIDSNIDIFEKYFLH